LSKHFTCLDKWGVSGTNSFSKERRSAITSDLSRGWIIPGRFRGTGI